MIHTVKGFRLAGVHCGLKPEGKKDLALVVSDRPCQAAGVFTTNRVKAAPVLYDRALLARPEVSVRAVLANAGNATACTGAQGLAAAEAKAAAAAQSLGCRPDEVLTLSTGVIGVPLPMDLILPGVRAAARRLEAGGWADAAAAIMTTDTRPKIASVRAEAGYTITGIAKGAGMIAPNMATMLAVVVTDAAAPRPVLARALRRVADLSFNRIVIDGDMSTNDTLLLLANGASGVEVGADDEGFLAALEEVCTALAQGLVRDGEGATKFVTLLITGAPDEAAARTVGNQIAASPLCKTAFYGGDPNWGRLLCAAGYSGVEVDPDRLALWLLDADGAPVMQLVQAGRPLAYDEPAAIALMHTPEWGFRLDLGLGEAAATLWTCDLSHDYVTINGHYRT